ncbi:cytochrome d ubiquinol oxidase subunit II [Hymenobacter busanensis]|uniref:Cytochrome d ubiquinol oxidase subunit II n=2 Tax=Hymenobacter busanensis TaxID=2607656 RepID=A0A7L5A352_9BACT|nr:cytochrome d ubiquinol oxidase subunit II [Hymenobacter busanensis]KAA9332486.1 cytochrome d ubiquinol oxidase subunit II [Hymenobacter busanensis]QHJ09663.1 cytochrome d ubiquinol oxidase subunit II [Hymenobacter busanensis]
MAYVVIAYLCLAILAYLLLGGADFGAGIVELFTRGKDRRLLRQTMYHAIGPIWEANHMWLIIAVVILFVGFPRIYSVMSTYLHIPLLLMLMGIIARGTAFVFRNYDAVHDQMQVLYGRVFRYSSLLTPFFLGVIAASLIAGYIDPQAPDFWAAYMGSWLHGFGLAVGAFTVALCAYLASVYTIGEANSAADRRRFVRETRRATVAAVLCGALVFGAAQLEGIPLANWVFGNAVGLSAIAAATASLVALWVLLPDGSAAVLRVLAGFQATMILLAVGYAHFPAFVVLRHGAALSLVRELAPAKTTAALGWALLVGSLFILPALFYLYYSFQRASTRPESAH